MRLHIILAVLAALAIATGLFVAHDRTDNFAIEEVVLAPMVEEPMSVAESVDEMEEVVNIPPAHAVPELPVSPTVETPLLEEMQPLPVVAEVPALPLADRDAIQRALPRIICANLSGTAISVRAATSSPLLFTAAHVVRNAILDNTLECEVHFPELDANSGFYVQTHKRSAEVLFPTETEKRYREEGIDLAVLRMLPEENEPVFSKGYPRIEYPLCATGTLGDETVLYGYSANIGTSAASIGTVLARFSGFITQYADIAGVYLLPDGAFRDGNAYLPELSFSLDERRAHPLSIVFSENNFSGASGGAVFNFSKNCLVGVNTATGRKDNNVFGLVVNPAAPEIKNWLLERGIHIE